VHERPVVVFSGGGTGGHLYPALAIADALRLRRPDVRALFVGARRGVEARVLPTRGEEHRLLPVEGVDRTAPLRSWRAIPGLLRSLFQVASLFREVEPEVVVVTGGYAGAPAGLVAGLMGIPLVLQEQNAVPGVSTRALTRWADRIHLAFPEAGRKLPASARAVTRMTGNPVRPASERDRDEARALFGLPADAVVVLIVGGSQGSRAINRIVGEATAELLAGRLSRPGRLHLLWATGPAHLEGVLEAFATDGCPDWLHPLGYIEDMPAALAAADLAVSRAGAMTTAEFLNQGLPSVLIPLPTAAAGHQEKNARALADAGAAIALAEQGLTGVELWAQLVALSSDEGARSRMTAAASARAAPNAADTIAADVESLLRTGGDVQ
jgi:UDP-N-acetylglucosamine--N-acetylmuramyl-(pentapeptide) pyrophosphoryl-undecaprenol N-acetylglucosamine transferase